MTKTSKLYNTTKVPEEKTNEKVTRLRLMLYDMYRSITRYDMYYYCCVQAEPLRILYFRLVVLLRVLIAFVS